MQFRDALRQRDFVVTASLPLGAASTAASVERDLGVLGRIVDAVQIVDDRDATGHIAGLAVAHLALARDIDPVLHLTCRDRNRVALQAELRGAAALGVTSLLIYRGEKLPREGFIRGKGVFDTNEQRLLRIAADIGAAPDVVPPPGFFLGTCVTAFAPGVDWQAERISQTVDSGARFIQTQPCLNAGVVERYLQRLVEQRVTHRASLLVEVPLLLSVRQARDYKGRNPSALVPDAVIGRIAEADDARAAGIAIAAEFVAALSKMPGVAGVNLCDVADVGDVAAVIQAAGIAR